MRERAKSILEASVGEHIKTGEPVTSLWLYETYGFGIKPAMIRKELNGLGESGYLYQAHPSGGRLPTDKAYRFFVKHLLASAEENGTVENKTLRSLLHQFTEEDWRTFIHQFSEHLQLLGFGYEFADGQVYESGLQELLSQLEVKVKAELLEVVRDFELLPERLIENTSRLQAENNWPQVFVGKNPFTFSNCLSVVTERFDWGRSSFLLIAIGPKRMDYKKSLRLFRLLEKSLN